jgi:DNA excision repair protein ERCC-2
MVQQASSSVNRLQHAVQKMEKTDSKRLNDEYQRLVEGLASSYGDLGDRDPGASSGAAASSSAAAGSGLNARARLADETDNLLANPVLPADLLKESVPGNIRRANHFLMFLRSWIEFLRKQLRAQSPGQKSTDAFLEELRVETKLNDLKALKFAYDRLQSLYRTLQITDMDEYNSLSSVVNLATMVAMYREGFTVLFEPHDERTPTIPDPRIQLCCLEASYAIKPVFERFRSVVITSGTLSPLDVFPKLLNFRPVVSESLTMSLTRNCICPMIVSRGDDQLPLTSSFEMRKDVGVRQNYGRLLTDLCAHVPDGLVCFFTSYSYMEDLVAAWKTSGVLDDILRYKLIFIETKDVVETTLALDAYKRACNRGRGAVFFSVARGKVAEGIDFDRHYGRGVVMFGIPFQYTRSRVLQARLTYLRERHQMSEAEFLSFDALRQTAQSVQHHTYGVLFSTRTGATRVELTLNPLFVCLLCFVCFRCLGRVIRSKMDYGLMVLADARYNRPQQRNKLPGWILQYLDKAHMNLSTERSLAVAKDFLKRMAQPRSHKEELGITMLDQHMVNRRMEEERKAKEQALMADEAEAAAHTTGAGFVPSSNTGIPRPAPTREDRWGGAQRATAATAALATTAAAPAAARQSGASAADAMELD